MVPDSANPSYKSKQALSSINLGWGICSSAGKKTTSHTKVFFQLLVRLAFAAKGLCTPFLVMENITSIFFPIRTLRGQCEECSNQKVEENKPALELNFLSDSNCASLDCEI